MVARANHGWVAASDHDNQCGADRVDYTNHVWDALVFSRQLRLPRWIPRFIISTKLAHTEEELQGDQDHADYQCRNEQEQKCNPELVGHVRQLSAIVHVLHDAWDSFRVVLVGVAVDTWFVLLTQDPKEVEAIDDGPDEVEDVFAEDEAQEAAIGTLLGWSLVGTG